MTSGRVLAISAAGAAAFLIALAIVASLGGLRSSPEAREQTSRLQLLPISPTAFSSACPLIRAGIPPNLTRIVGPNKELQRLVVSSCREDNGGAQMIVIKLASSS